MFLLQLKWRISGQNSSFQSIENLIPFLKKSEKFSFLVFHQNLSEYSGMFYKRHAHLTLKSKHSSSRINVHQFEFWICMSLNQMSYLLFVCVYDEICKWYGTDSIQFRLWCRVNIWIIWCELQLDSFEPQRNMIFG